MLLEKEQRTHELNRSLFRSLRSYQSLDNSQSLLLSEKTDSEKTSNLELLWQRNSGERLACCYILQSNVTLKPSEDQPKAILSALDSITPHTGVKKKKKSVQHVNEERKGCSRKRNLDITVSILIPQANLSTMSYNPTYFYVIRMNSLNRRSPYCKLRYQKESSCLSWMLMDLKWFSTLTRPNNSLIQRNLQTYVCKDSLLLSMERHSLISTLARTKDHSSCLTKQTIHRIISVFSSLTLRWICKAC